jgi:NAD(P)-dependent dehydrogenase (short-subunit alcohol dehydrogenase family)
MNTILITGCSSGFGLETASFFLERKRNVIATMWTPRADVRGCYETRRSRASSLRTDYFREDDFVGVILPSKRTRQLLIVTVDGTKWG